jgi:hypothetical protein
MVLNLSRMEALALRCATDGLVETEFAALMGTTLVFPQPAVNKHAPTMLEMNRPVAKNGD